MRHYELRFTTERGRVIRGPIFGKEEHVHFKRVLLKMYESNLLMLTIGSKVFVIPEKILRSGHAEIKPVGFLYSLIRSWRAQ